jgi:hypothetical protein
VTESVHNNAKDGPPWSHSDRVLVHSFFFCKLFVILNILHATSASTICNQIIPKARGISVTESVHNNAKDGPPWSHSDRVLVHSFFFCKLFVILNILHATSASTMQRTTMK